MSDQAWRPVNGCTNRTSKIASIMPLCRTSAQGIGLGTGAAAAQRGYYVIYPVDCLLSESAFREAYAAWHMGVGGPLATTRNAPLSHYIYGSRSSVGGQVERRNALLQTQTKAGCISALGHKRTCAAHKLMSAWAKSRQGSGIGLG